MTYGIVFVILLFIYCPTSSFAVLHTFSALLTQGLESSGFPKLTFSELVGEDELYYYNSNNKTLIRRYDWLKEVEKFNFLDLHYEFIFVLEANADSYANDFIVFFKETNEIQIGQMILGCEIDQEDQNGDFFIHFGFNGVALVDANLDKLTCTVLLKEAEYMEDDCITSLKRNSHSVVMLREVCTLWLKEFLRYGNKTLERKAQPKISVFEKINQTTSEIKVVCHVTGFFPRDIEVIWVRNELDDLPSEGGDILPNNDKTYQVRKTIIVNRMDLGRHSYSCHVDHTSLTKKLTVAWKYKETGPVMEITVAIAAVILIAIVISSGVLIRRKKRGASARDTEIARNTEELRQMNSEM
ncbi:major histocompatibility complex class I-related gene protein-like isoform X1 [Erpetoichthys calabaricus]|uniref:Major histocompatibility complex class I-related gene protein-like n=1 Tax=Erpetoichthys calabaricus TaxID=27687 RepID=A0A8C4XCL4_ERPCA|nr:major histocompatibility complex class I-related gene protein-like isoform X1 [Erpetoichthys calabaricus]